MSDAPKKAVLRATNVSKHYPLRQGMLDRLRRVPPRVVKAVDDVDLTIEAGEVVGLMGESGCGKTTLGKVLCRLVSATAGEIKINDHNLLSLNKTELRQLRPTFQMLFQNPYSTLNPKMTVAQLLRETLEVNLSLDRQEQDRRIDEVLEQVGLSHRIKAFPTELSGGERRRVGLARLLLLKPSLIVADEPVAGLDASIKAKVVDLMLETRTPDMAYLFISHDLPVIRYVADRILVMFLGTIVEELPVATFNEDGEELHHPYTLTLLEASRQVSLRRSAQEAVDFEDLPSHEEFSGVGCPYASRCPWVGTVVDEALCKESKPPLFEVAEGHRIACHRYAK